jgi:hypothetical protein
MVDIGFPSLWEGANCLMLRQFAKHMIPLAERLERLSGILSRQSVTGVGVWDISNGPNPAVVYVYAAGATDTDSPLGSLYALNVDALFGLRVFDPGSTGLLGGQQKDEAAHTGTLASLFRCV